MKRYDEVLFTPAASVEIASTEAAQSFEMPTADPDNAATTVQNRGAGVIHLKFASGVTVGLGTGSLPVPAGQTVLFQPGDGSFGDAASIATELTIAGRGAVTVTRGTATAQMVFADR